MCVPENAVVRAILRHRQAMMRHSDDGDYPAANKLRSGSSRCTRAAEEAGILGKLSIGAPR